MLKPLLQKGIEDKIFTAASAVVVAQDANDLMERAAVGLVGETPVEIDSAEPIFDIASLTKPVVASALLRLVSKGSIRLDQPLSDFFPELISKALGASTVEHLLAHEAGMDPWLPLFEAIPRELKGTDYGLQAVLDQIFETQRDRESTELATYSDLGYVLLGELLSRHFSKPLADIINEQVCIPLRLTTCSYRPLAPSLAAGGLELIAPTTIRSWRKETLVGEVHDDNAWTMGGVAGHAGLFGTATDVAGFGTAWLNAYRGDAHWMSTRQVRLAVSPRASGRALVWDMKSAEASAAGTLMSDATFGHLGFTGCSLWIDPKQHVVIALLTNRVHLDAENGKIKAYRPWFHDEVVSGLGL